MGNDMALRACFRGIDARSLMQTLKREFLLLQKNPLHWIMPLLFFLLTGFIFPLSVSPATHELQIQMMGPGVIWVSILLALLLSQAQLFQRDFESGVLDQLLIQPSSLSLHLSKKIFSHWLMIIFPMIVLTPLLSLLYHLSFFAIMILLSSLVLGTPILCIQGMIVSALCVGIRKEGLLLAIILLPLYIPTLIFGTTVVGAALLGQPVLFQLELLGAMLILALAIGISVAAFALRIGITYS